MWNHGVVKHMPLMLWSMLMTQLYLVVKPDDHTSSIHKLEKCVQDIRTCSIKNKLVLNDGKTEIIHIYSNFTKNCPTCPDINIGNVTITPKTEVRDLGVIIDKHLSFMSQINNVCKSAFYALNNIRKIRKYLDSHSTERLIHAFISSHIDNCNSLFCGLPVAEIAKLQRVQNAAARLVTGSKRTEHIMPTLRNIHWLPVEQRIKLQDCSPCLQSTKWNVSQLHKRTYCPIYSCR